MRRVVDIFSSLFRGCGVGIIVLMFALGAAGGAEARQARIVIDFIYSDAREFSEGLAAVRSDGLWGYIDHTNRVVIPFTYNVPEVGRFSEGLAFVGNYFINTQGQPALNGRTFEQASSFSEGLAAVQSGGQWGFINLEGNFSILPVYEGAGDFSGGRAPVKRNGLWGYIDTQGRMLISPRFTWANAFSGDERNLAAVEYEGRVGYIDRSGRLIVPPIYEQGGDFRNSLAPVKGPSAYDIASHNPVASGGWGYVNPSGREVIPRRFHWAGRFENGLAPVATDARWGFIDVRGRLVLEALYDGARPFSEGMAAVERGGRWGYIRAR